MKFFLLFSFSVVSSLVCSAQPQITTTGNNTINVSNPYQADVTIGSDANGNGVRHDGSIMLWSNSSASRISTTSDLLNFSGWSSGVPNVSFSTTVGGTAYLMGNVGMGVTTPASRLELASGPSGTSTAVFHINGGVAWGNALTLVSDNTNGADDPRMTFSYRNKSKQWSLGGQYNTTRFSIWEDSGDGIYNTAPNNAGGYGTERFTVATGGNVGIGTSAPDEKLTVKGTIHSQAVKVDLNVPGPDYVFKKYYNLPRLSQVKNYVDKNQHLSEIPSADQMAKNGVDIGDMNIKLLKKVEELTLYLIDENKKNQLQSYEIHKLKRQVVTLLKNSRIKD